MWLNESLVDLESAAFAYHYKWTNVLEVLLLVALFQVLVHVLNIVFEFPGQVLVARVQFILSSRLSKMNNCTSLRND